MTHIRTILQSAIFLFALSCSAQTLTLVKDINPSSASSLITSPQIWGDRAFMGATTATAGTEPWSTNGTTTTQTMDIWPGVQNSNPRFHTVFMDHLVFSARKNGAMGDRLYAIPKASATIHEVVPINFPGAYGGEKATEILGLYAHQNKLYVATNANGTGAELHVWQTTPGPQFMTGAYGGVGNAGNAGSPLGALGGALGGAYTPTKDWYWLGIIRDINPNGGSDPEAFITFNDKVYFTADNGTNGREQWVTDGTSIGTSLVKDINPGAVSSGINGFVIMGSKLYFTATTASHGSELWFTDGTTAGTLLVKDINTKKASTLVSVTGPTQGSSPKGLTVWSNKLYFSADNGTNGNELWVSDGTAAGTTMIKDINATGNSDPKCFSGYAVKGLVNGVSVNKVYLAFAANDGVNGEELWRTDGTAAGTVLLKDLKAGSGGSSPTELVALTTTTGLSDGTYYYSAIGGTNGRELWEFKATTGAHRKIAPAVAPNADPLGKANNFPWVVMNNAMYFYANYDSNGGELWKVTR